MAAVQLKREIDGCGMSWSVSSPAKMKWAQPEPKPITRYRLDYSGRARKF